MAVARGDRMKLLYLLDLLARGNKLDARDNVGSTALHYAAESGNADIAHVLIEARADVNALDKQGSTPLHYAAKMGHESVARALLKFHADLNAVNSHGYTPYAMAQDWGTCAIAQFLQDCGGSR